RFLALAPDLSSSSLSRNNGRRGNPAAIPPRSTSINGACADPARPPSYNPSKLRGTSMKQSAWIFLSAILFLVSQPVLAQSGGGKGVDLASELPSDAHQLKIGDPAPDFSLKGVDGKIYTLADFKDAPILMVAFLSNHCPYSHAADSRLVPMAEELKSKGLA